MAPASLMFLRPNPSEIEAAPSYFLLFSSCPMARIIILVPSVLDPIQPSVKRDPCFGKRVNKYERSLASYYKGLWVFNPVNRCAMNWLCVVIYTIRYAQQAPRLIRASCQVCLRALNRKEVATYAVTEACWPTTGYT